MDNPTYADLVLSVSVILFLPCHHHQVAGSLQVTPAFLASEIGVFESRDVGKKLFFHKDLKIHHRICHNMYSIYIYIYIYIYIVNLGKLDE